MSASRGRHTTIQRNEAFNVMPLQSRSMGLSQTFPPLAPLRLPHLRPAELNWLPCRAFQSPPPPLLIVCDLSPKQTVGEASSGAGAVYENNGRFDWVSGAVGAGGVWESMASLPLMTLNEGTWSWCMYVWVCVWVPWPMTAWP